MKQFTLAVILLSVQLKMLMLCMCFRLNLDMIALIHIDLKHVGIFY